MLVYRKYFILSFLFYVFYSSGTAALVVELFPDRREENNKKISQTIPQTFTVAVVQYQSDVVFEAKEFQYLTGLKDGITITCCDVQYAIHTLFSKQKFEKITLSLDQQDESFFLHCALTGFWTLEKLKFHGIVIGKDRYQQFYGIDPGQSFTKEVHDRSIDQIKQAFFQEGYFDAVIDETLEWNVDKKTVVAHIYLSRGKKYKCGQVQVVEKEVDAVQPQDLKKINEKFAARFARRGYFRKSINKEVEAIKKDLTRLGYVHVEIELRERVHKKNRTVDLIFIVDVVKQRKFLFWGNSFFSDQQLLDAVLLFGRSAWLVPVSVLGQEVEQLYHKKGFWSVSVSCKEEGPKEFFVVNEGSRSKIKSVVCRGVHYVSQKEIIRRCFKPLLRKKYFDHEVMEGALQRLQEFYHAHGFLDMKIIHQEFVVTDLCNALYEFHVVVDEGPRVVINNITVPAFKDIESVMGFAKWSCKKRKQYFDSQELQDQKRRLERYLQKKGYVDFSIKPNLIRGDDETTFEWNVAIHDSRERFGKTIVCGSCDFPFERMQRELCYKEDDLWDKKKIKQSVDRLRSLEVFESVHLYPDYTFERDGKRDLLLKVCKDDPCEFRFRAGAGLEQVTRHTPFGKGATYKIGGTFFLKNPTNRGDSFVVEADVSRSYRNTNLEYCCPYVFGMPCRSRVKLYANKYEQPGFVGSKKDLYELTQQGFLVGIQEACRFFDAGINIGFEWMKTDIKRGMELCAQNVAQAIRFQSDLLSQKVPYFFIEPVLVIDHLDNKLNPTSGMFTLLTLKAMLPLKEGLPDAQFIKCMAEQSFFHGFGPCVLALRVRAGAIFYQAFENIMPFERFYLGGAHSVRSYETDLCPPLGCFVDEDCVYYCVPQGGKSMVNANIELRFPLLGPVTGVAFQDFGTLLGSSFAGIADSDLLAATGFGIRYNTPIGPLRFDIGWKWRACKPSDYSYAWFLTLGHAF